MEARYKAVGKMNLIRSLRRTTGGTSLRLTEWFRLAESNGMVQNRGESNGMEIHRNKLEGRVDSSKGSFPE